MEKQRTVPQRLLRNYCMGNMKKFLLNTTLHGLKFVADSSITVFERSFFVCAFIAALIVTITLISNIYARWNNTPVIIGTSPHPTSILDIPFPAITVCNMNQVLLSKVSNYSENSFENALLKLLCFTEIELDESLNESPNFKNNNLKIADFIIEHAQPCSRMLLSCRFSFSFHNCRNLFREVLTDEGLCCAFNVLHPDFLFQGPYKILKESMRNDNSIPVNWNPETGYPQILPENYYPVPASGPGVLMGFSLILNAELNEYYCSSTNGAGFKISLHNPIETPNVKETGLSVPVGYETRFRIDALRSEAVPNIRTIPQKSRQCLFNKEEKLLYYKHYTRRNCENECLAKFLNKNCKCIPFDLPLIFANTNICNVSNSFCIDKAKKLSRRMDDVCRSRCLTSCFDLSFLPTAFSVPLVQQNYLIPNELLQSMSKDNIKQNIAVIHFYYSNNIFHGDLKNVYIGFTEFLSNTGGILGLFMGFSFISLAEIFYFGFLRPIFEHVLPQRKHRQHKGGKQRKLNEKRGSWLRDDLHILMKPNPKK